MVISLNILTQLESLLVNFLSKRSKITIGEFAGFRSEIQKKHIDFLKKYTSILISDFAEVITGDERTRKVITTLLTEVPSGRSREEWTWNFDLIGTDFFNRRSVMKVLAVTI